MKPRKNKKEKRSRCKEHSIKSFKKKINESCLKMIGVRERKRIKRRLGKEFINEFLIHFEQDFFLILKCGIGEDGMGNEK